MVVEATLVAAHPQRAQAPLVRALQAPTTLLAPHRLALTRRGQDRLAAVATLDLEAGLHLPAYSSRLASYFSYSLLISAFLLRRPCF